MGSYKMSVLVLFLAVLAAPHAPTSSSSSPWPSCFSPAPCADASSRKGKNGVKSCTTIETGSVTGNPGFSLPLGGSSSDRVLLSLPPVWLCSHQPTRPSASLYPAQPEPTILPQVTTVQLYPPPHPTSCHRSCMSQVNKKSTLPLTLLLFLRIFDLS